MAEVAASGRTWVRLRERALVFLGVCLPVPVFAATGLSVPLPATVERMAAKLVPFGDVVPLGDAPVQTRGAIVLTQPEHRRLLIVTPAAPPAVRVEAETPPQQFEQRKTVLSPRRLAVRVETNTKPARTRPPAQREPEPGPPPAAAPTDPVGDGPEPGAEKPKPALPPQPRPRPRPRPKPDEEAKPKPKPKPDREQPNPKEPKEPKEPKPNPKPEPPPEPDTPRAEDEDAVEQDKGAHDGKQGQTASASNSADGR
jgi:hypothetical protein